MWSRLILLVLSAYVPLWWGLSFYGEQTLRKYDVFFPLGASFGMISLLAGVTVLVLSATRRGWRGFGLVSSLALGLACLVVVSAPVDRWTGGNAASWSDFAIFRAVIALFLVMPFATTAWAILANVRPDLFWPKQQSSPA